VLLVMIDLTTNLTTLALAALFDTSQSGVDRDHPSPDARAGLHPATRPRQLQPPWIIDATLIPVQDRRSPPSATTTAAALTPKSSIALTGTPWSRSAIALLFAADALDFKLDLTAALSLIHYLLAAAYALKLTATRETYGDGKSPVPDMVVAAVATVYTLFLMYAAGVDKLLLSCILYAPAAALYFKARRERGLRVCRPAEAVLFGVIVLGAVAVVVSLASGPIEIQRPAVREELT
jgi:arginine:ornithine antiporter/lysine permease